MSSLNFVRAFAPIAALSAFAAFSAFAPAKAGGGSDVPVKPEQADGYPGNPTRPLGSLMQDYTSLKLSPKGGGRYELKLGPAADAPDFKDVDLRPFVPRVPALARGDATLTRIALMQREFNRNETKLGPIGDFAESKLANNCLRSGLWEVILEKKKDDGSTGMKYHGWFDFPKEEYAKVFEEVNGVKFADYEKVLAQYPAMGGFAVPLEKLRTVVRDHEVTKFDLHLADKPDLLPEQKRKAHLLLNKEVATYADFVDPKKQPITTARFAEPGYYDPKEPVKFDLAWLAHVKSIHVREVKGVADPVAMGEVEVVYENGNRILLGDADLGKAAPLAKAPEKDGDVLRVTFGISTPDIYATLAERTAEFTSGRANYLMLLDVKGNHLDNHATGIDRVFLYKSGTGAGELNLLLVGYERIAIVSHLSFAAATP